MTLDESQLADAQLQLWTKSKAHDSQKAGFTAWQKSQTEDVQESSWDAIDSEMIMHTSYRPPKKTAGTEAEPGEFDDQNSASATSSPRQQQQQQGNRQSPKHTRGQRSSRQKSQGSHFRSYRRTTGFSVQTQSPPTENEGRAPSDQDSQRERQPSGEDGRALAAQERMKAHRAQNPYLETRQSAQRRTSHSQDQRFVPALAPLPPRFQQRNQQHFSQAMSEAYVASAASAQLPSLPDLGNSLPHVHTYYPQMQPRMFSMPYGGQPVSHPHMYHPMPMLPMMGSFEPPALSTYWHAVPYMTYWGPTGEPHFYDIPMFAADI